MSTKYLELVSSMLIEAQEHSDKINALIDSIDRMLELENRGYQTKHLLIRQDFQNTRSNIKFHSHELNGYIYRLLLCLNEDLEEKLDDNSKYDISIKRNPVK